MKKGSALSELKAYIRQSVYLVNMAKRKKNIYSVSFFACSRV